MKNLQLRFMYLVIRFMAKFMLYGAAEMRNPDSLGVSHFTDQLIALGDDLRNKLHE